MSLALTEADLTLTESARLKIADLLREVEGGIQGVRVFATAGGCSGISFGMTFTEVIHEDDGVLSLEGCKVVVDDGTLEYLRGVEIDFIDRGDGQATFIFNNLPQIGGCGSGCGSSGGGCC